MAVKIIFPYIFRGLIDNKEYDYFTSGKISDLLKDICMRYPKLAPKIIDREGRLKGYVKLFLIGEDSVIITDNSKKVKNGDIIKLVVAIAGG